MANFLLHLIAWNHKEETGNLLLLISPLFSANLANLRDNRNDRSLIIQIRCPLNIKYNIDELH